MIWFPITNLLLFLDDGRKLCIRDSRIQLTLKGKYMHSVTATCIITLKGKYMHSVTATCIIISRQKYE